MKKGVKALLLLLLSAAQTAVCGQDNSKTNEMTMKKQSKVLVACFSRAGENYAVGRIERGNTRIVAEMIAAETGGELFAIDPVAPYPEDYTECTEVAKRELEAGARPAIVGDVAVEDYDVIFIGYPNWWGDMPMPVYTFIERHDWRGKIVVPFCTHEGSGLSGTERKIAAACEGATLRKGLAVRGAAAQHERDEVRRSVGKWLEREVGIKNS